MSLPERIYTGALRAALPLLPFLAQGDGKLARGVRGRAGVLRRMQAWAREHRDPARPLVWFHAPSVGEGLQARAVIEAFRRRRPDAQVAYTFFSPSAEGFARTVPADFADYLPLDLPGHVGPALDALRPSVLAFSKADVWPNLTREAVSRDVRLALLSGTLPATSSRLRGPARALLGASYARLDRVAAISSGDAERLAALGVPAERCSVMGDARFDQVWHRASGVDRASPLLSPLIGFSGVTLVAGSTWPADEERLIPAFAAARHAVDGGMRLVLVPHEPTELHLQQAEARLDALGIPHARLATVLAGAPVPDVLVVDRVGVLGDLYAAADLAYVGGGFGSAGLHSVLEPAAFGIPVLFGPRHANAREAAELVDLDGAVSTPDDEALRDTLAALAGDADDRARPGGVAREYVRAGLGAAERGADVVEELLDLPVRR
jgi:3-deoxy-D-manno-octulosonic-acid transferase